MRFRKSRVIARATRPLVLTLHSASSASFAAPEAFGLKFGEGLPSVRVLCPNRWLSLMRYDSALRASRNSPVVRSRSGEAGGLRDAMSAGIKQRQVLLIDERTNNKIEEKLFRVLFLTN
jgi:hypothetical protein